MYGFDLAERLGDPDPFALMERIPGRLLTWWRARDRLRQPGRWKELQEQMRQEAMSPDELMAEQIAACNALIRGAAAQTEARDRRLRTLRGK